jgi:hypothetical protein
MSQEKYIGMDVHQATISVAVRDTGGKLIMESVLETKATTILEFVQGLRGTLALTFEEGTSAAWLHDLLKPHVSRLVVCDPRKNAPLPAYLGQSANGQLRGLEKLCPVLCLPPNLTDCDGVFGHRWKVLLDKASVAFSGNS